MMTPATRIHGFPPLVGSTSRVLILGSMPGAASLSTRAYYAHPRNAFWPLVAGVIGVDADAPYDDRARALVRAGLALWDVARSCVRQGSLDAAIDDASVDHNDVAGLLHAHRAIRRVCCNGAKAAALYRKHVAATVVELELDVRVLPSTSPAHAAMPLTAKRARWLAALGD
jgi:hypoxanthine-DNA glycosylase